MGIWEERFKVHDFCFFDSMSYPDWSFLFFRKNFLKFFFNINLEYMLLSLKYFCHYGNLFVSTKDIKKYVDFETHPLFRNLNYSF